MEIDGRTSHRTSVVYSVIWIESLIWLLFELWASVPALPMTLECAHLAEEIHFSKHSARNSNKAVIQLFSTNFTGFIHFLRFTQR